jgi:hypothetical protein
MTSSPDNPPISPRASGQSIEALVARIEAPRPEPLWTIERACCCTAQPMVKVLMPPVRPGGEPVDLLLCGHHYRESKSALLTAGATAFDKDGELLMPTAWQVDGRSAVPQPSPRAATEP